MSDLVKVLDVLGYDEEEKTIAISSIGNLRRIITISKDTLFLGGMNAGMIDEIMLFRNWYIKWKNSEMLKQETGVKSEMQKIEEAFTPAVWEVYILGETSNSMERTSLEKDKETTGGLNVSYKVEAKITGK